MRIIKYFKILKQENSEHSQLQILKKKDNKFVLHQL